MNRTTALWSIWMVASLILAGLVLHLFLDKRVVAELPNREALTEHLRQISTCSIGLDGLYH